MRTVAPGVVVAFVAVAACKQRDPATPRTCEPLAVTVDGVPLPPVGHGLARANNMHGDVSYEVQLTNQPGVTCEQLLSEAGRAVPDGEIMVRAFAGGAGLTGHGVGIDAHSQMGGAVTLLAKPRAIGDLVEVCVDHMSFTPIAGAYKGTHVTVSGRFAGAYCGEMTW